MCLFNHRSLGRSLEFMLCIGLCRIRISTQLLNWRFSSEEGDYNGTLLVSNGSSLPLFTVVLWLDSVSLFAHYF